MRIILSIVLSLTVTFIMILTVIWPLLTMNTKEEKLPNIPWSNKPGMPHENLIEPERPNLFFAWLMLIIEIMIVVGILYVMSLIFHHPETKENCINNCHRQFVDYACQERCKNNGI